MFIDTHCHLNIMVKKKIDSLLQESDYIHIGNIVYEASEKGVSTVINVGTSINESLNSVNIAERFKNIYASVGIHPCDASDSWRKDFDEIIKLSDNGKVIAIGETGLDFYHKPFNKQRQIDCFKAHIDLALKKSLPVIVHIRSAESEVLKILEGYKSELNGVNHCYQGEQYVADHLLEWGFYLGIDGPITYPKNEPFRKVVSQLPIDRLLLETDAPFLAPQEFRGKPNHPKYIPSFAKVIADLKGISLEELASATTNNAKKLFKL